jgi:hypothetical protein
MLGLINKSLANTTLSLAAYYIPDSMMNGVVENFGAAILAGPLRFSYADTWSIWASAVGSVNSINWGLQFAYVDGDADIIVAATGASLVNTGWDATYGVAGKIGSSWGDLDAELVVGYINDGDYSLKTAGAGSAGTASAFWTFNGDFGGDIVGDDVWSIRADAGYKLPVGKIFGNIGYWDAGGDAAWDKAFDIRVGYKFTVAGINSKIEYRYLDLDGQNGEPDDTRQRIRVEAYYKF